MRQSNSGQAIGKIGSPQTSLQQEELKQIAAKNEAAAKWENYLRTELSKTAPMKIPSNATIKDEKTCGYRKWTKREKSRAAYSCWLPI